MADFTAVLKKTIDGLDKPTPAMRQRVYEKARATIEQKLAAAGAGPGAAAKQRKALETAIASVERGYAGKEGKPKSAKPAAGKSSAPPASPVGAGIAPAASRSAAPAKPKAKANMAPPTAAGPPSEFDDILFGPEGPPEDYLPAAPTADERSVRRPSARRPSSGSRKRLVPVAIAVVAVAAIGLAGWSLRQNFAEFLGSAPQTVASQTTMAPSKAPGASVPVPAKEERAGAAPAETPVHKFTQRLLPDGKEVNPGPAPEPPNAGEGTSLAAQSTKVEAPPANAATQQNPASSSGASSQSPQSSPQTESETLPVGEKAFFYEEKTGDEAGTADTGAVVWSEIKQSPGNGLPPEPAIRADVTIPDRGIKLRLTIERNADKSLPASHLIELVFTLPHNFAGGAIDNVQRVAFKDTEQVAGNPLVAIPAKIADNFFIVALNNAPTAVKTNLMLMRQEEWIDIPITYRTGRRALITLEKGVPGDRVFDDVLKAWNENAGG